ncbi:unnamed protein product [Effrenium voratum]|uniref:HD domain-containing protein n=1 Tax=Effrenium voratum TaxID=2562239 RepID=A0AA36J3B9_9DINO|nr:unnamed protein product [Effrenium voratum]CAJ1398830.1 unnamed protein product [Effrenium voratum]CAJ1449946.1 unnamed protein product [Effrenium voratum]|mmetsp:Transcript_128067/g.304088  ORF Transcript_128067/g.304088 Transcript_128067/m.304088 type:complete len:217 (+) Transcript_128067:63-713(+)
MLRKCLVVLTAVGLYGAQPRLFPGEASADFKVLKAEDAPVLMAHLKRYEKELGGDFLAYRNHCLRVLSFTTYFLGKEPDAGGRRVLESALAFHDLGLWSDMAASYLGPSTARARKDLQGEYSEAELNQVEDIIMNHHKFTELADPLADAMRKADWLDFTNNLRFPLRSGMPSGNIAKANEEMPLEGFFTALLNRPFNIRPDNPIKAGLEVMEIFRW